MDDLAAYADRLRLSHRLREGALRPAIEALGLPGGSQGLDAGCGIGLHTAMLAQTVGPGGHVTGLDVLPGFIKIAEGYAGRLNLADQISFRQGDINRLPFQDHTFDWAWSADTVYAGAVGDPLAITTELARVVKPGGLVALAFWSGQKLLPGYPLLEARLDAGFAGRAPYLRDVSPELQYMSALGWLREAGLTDLTARTFAADFYAPLDGATRSALAMTFKMLWDDARRDLSREDHDLYARLCEEGSPGFILDSPAYFAFLSYALFQGRVTEERKR